MNCLSDFECEYHSKHGLIEKIILLSMNNDDCVIRIMKNNSLIRTSTSNIQLLIKPHQPIKDIKLLKIKDDILLKEEMFCTFVSVVKIYEDDTLDVLIKSNILVDGEQMLHTHVENLYIVGKYLSLDGLRLLDLTVDVEYSRYLNNITIFKPLMSRVQNAIICWHADEDIVRVRAMEEESLKRIERLMPVFIHELGVLVGGDTQGRVDVLARHIVWEYQFEDEEEANFAIGVKGAHIVAVRNMTGVAGAVLTKANRLRIIAENKNALKESRSLLEIKRESYLFEESVVPMLIGKNASHITELMNKSGLHCVHLPNNASNGVIQERPLIIDATMIGKRELFLFGTRESITSAKLLLEIEESVKDLRRELQGQKLNKHSSSASSVSKECEKSNENGKQGLLEVEGDKGLESNGRKEEEEVAVLSWADTPLEDSEEEEETERGRGGVMVSQEEDGNEGGRGMAQVAGQGSRGKKNAARKTNRKQNEQYHMGVGAVPGNLGGLVFTNTALSFNGDTGAHRTRSSGTRQNWPNNNNHNHNNYYHQYHQPQQQHKQQQQQQQQSLTWNRHNNIDDNDSLVNNACAQ